MSKDYNVKRGIFSKLIFDKLNIFIYIGKYHSLITEFQ